MLPALYLTAACILAGTASALVGFEPQLYDPMCAHGCLRFFSAPLLNCSTPDDPIAGMMVLNTKTRPHCFAHNEPYLTSLAYCVKQECASEGLSALKLETFWAKHATGDPMMPPMWSYADALMYITEPPTMYGNPEMPLNHTMLAVKATMEFTKETLASTQYEGMFEGRASVAMLVVFFVLPIIITWIGYLPYMTTLSEKIKPNLIWPSIFGSYHVQPLPYQLGNAPTLGQTIYIVVFIIVNIVMTVVNYRVAVPHQWYGSSRYWVTMMYVVWRTGFYALAFLPLLILFSGRNNVLLWLTNWSHSTYMVLHRWVARVFAVHVLLHSVLSLAFYVKSGKYEKNYNLPWWIWGIVATLTTTIMMVCSGLWVRSKSYETFLIAHILLAVFTIIGTWYHIWYCFQWLSNYQHLIYPAIGVWAFDRVVRVLRISKNGVRYAQVVDIGEGYVRIDVPGIRWGITPGQNAYAHFPTINKWRPWENHPFSVMPTPILHSHRHTLASSNGSQANSSHEDDIEMKTGASAIPTLVNSSTQKSTGITFFVKKSTGLTKHLNAHDSLLTLLDGPYPNNPTDAIMKTDRLLIIAGGIGVSGVLSWVFAHPNVKFAWSVKSSAECLVHNIEAALAGVVDKDIRIGSRLNVADIIDQEVEAGWEKVGVVACGPGELCDVVRAEVVKAAKAGSTRFELEVDAYSW